jgi:hypothetical protein
MITNAMRATLVDELDYTDEEVSAMRPEIAAQLIKTKTKRPFGDRPMPEAWKRGGSIERRSGGGLFSNNLVRLAVVAIFGLVGAVATGKMSVGTLLGGQEFGRKRLTKLSDEVKKPSKKRRKKSRSSKKKVVREVS